MSKSVHPHDSENDLNKTVDEEFELIKEFIQNEMNERFKMMKKDLQDAEKYIHSKCNKMLLQMNIALGLAVFALIVWIIVFVKFI